MYSRRTLGDLRQRASQTEQAAAWITFTGTGTPVPDDSNLVTSITDNGVGDYTLTWAQAFASTNYVMIGGGRNDGAGDNAQGHVAFQAVASPQTAASCRIATYNRALTAADFGTVNVAVWGRR